MSKESFLRWPIDRQHGKRSETLIQSQRQYLYHIHRSLWNQLSWKKWLLVTWNVLRPFVNTLTADDKYSALSRNNSLQTIQINWSEKQKTFSHFLRAFLKSTSNFEDFQKEMTLIAYGFPKLQTPKDVVS